MILLDLLHTCLLHLFSSLSPYPTIEAQSPLALCQLAPCHLSLHRLGIFPTPFLDNSYLSLKLLRCCLLRQPPLPSPLPSPGTSRQSVLPSSLQTTTIAMRWRLLIGCVIRLTSLWTAPGQELSGCPFSSQSSSAPQFQSTIIYLLLCKTPSTPVRM